MLRSKINNQINNQTRHWPAHDVDNWVRNQAIDTIENIVIWKEFDIQLPVLHQLRADVLQLTNS